ncbi:helix-turn-helix transcriptional regulator [Candidatus Tisiphia endosymbiont of Beris chalybata]|uniref:helix-turn-helix domain-containing protein n=1 Tax=Candidatus Tisiphia endosymbiont of Beris chalybata TaxID=3066262 RepID=UPI00312C9D6A
MSHLIIKKNIERLLKERDWRVADLENKIGQSRSVTNIFRGASKNPTIEVLQAIAKALDVDLQELLLDHDSNDSVLNIALLRDTCNKIINELEGINYPITVKYSNIFTLIREVYEYSTQLNLVKADDNFTKWLIHKHYKH